ncbi:uncharacterized protein TRAVEDRAFT_42513 [Trametes versicolor FP-101664 SS1]|uniref:uncharacterized protein n=1 Tax=Trametes versicolor (strain FP-101664) TaxID=717944 RepID=UPI0004621592|nr:uncharacterized protein TRAVEDRAFT_42513 [Trametes versicolor FP-101664 SS1]EIW65129.1 hypothetical protein TRAVEDRAFT_42513 [Trametes versicolor FP-101664 SS1]
MVLIYGEYAQLRRGLDGGVSAVAFSSKGTYIAAAGTLDCTVYLWRIADRKLVKTFKGSSPNLCMQWLPDQEDKLLCGNQSGCIDHIQLMPDAFNMAGFRAHEHPVEYLDINDLLLVSGAQSEVAVWERQDVGLFQHIIDIPKPPRSSHNEDSEVLVTGVRWTTSKRRSSLLLVSYMFHGMVIYDTSWNRVRTIPTPGLVQVDAF